MKIDKERYEVWNRKNLNIIHFMVNPGLAFNELILGQRLPQIMLIDRLSNKPLMERTIIPCTHCETFHDGRTWSAQNGTAFKNWFGLFCPKCQEIIPCIRNYTSLTILFITYPLWFWWIKAWKKTWLKNQPARYEQIDLDLVTHKKARWIRIGTLWGLFMFIAMFATMPLVSQTNYSWELALITLPIWLLGGLGFGYAMKWWLGKKDKAPG
ncbi:MAG: hypothetical protein ABJP45_14085 [Cyclobacteriaceae bacterium]